MLILPPAALATDSTYVGSQSCATCHASEYQNWQSSHHYRAMLTATEESVTGNFDDQSFEYAGNTHRFYRRDGKFLVETDDANGDMQEFEIAYTFGFYPLQQYLVQFPDGRLQALNIVWDSRPQSEGGQRWYHLYPDDVVGHEDIVHWTGSFQNWNSRCAACHSTNLEKNYSLASNTYNTTWSEINVGCEACHGPGSDHVAWAISGPEGTADSPDPGFLNSMDAGEGGRGTWMTANDHPTKKRSDGQRADRQAGVCAACHSLRIEMDEHHAGKKFDDLFQLRLLEDGLYYPDGQIHDEVYVYGSFLQSKMYQAGVACTNCHEPHSGKLLTEGNALCSQCHQPAVFDQPEHHHHDTASSGAACVNCHMPATTYMGVDDRRDHSFRIPEPRLSSELGIPNACNRCHQDKDATWAEAARAGWNATSMSGVNGVIDSSKPGKSTLYASHAPVLAAARENRQQALPGLIGLAADPTQPAILRATAVMESARFPSQETLASLQNRIGDPDPMVRMAAAGAMDALPAAQRYALLQPLITDPSRVVRMEVARQLASVSPSQISANGRSELIALRNEYLDTLKLNIDMPGTLINLGVYLTQSGQPEEAERIYRQALKLAPSFVPAMLNLADLYRANGLDVEAEKWLTEATRIAPDDPAAQYALGLLKVRQKNLPGALKSLQKAADLEPENPRYTYVLAVAQFESGQQQKALQTLRDGLANHPGNPDMQAALDAYENQSSQSR